MVEISHGSSSNTDCSGVSQVGFLALELDRDLGFSQGPPLGVLVVVVVVFSSLGLNRHLGFSIVVVAVVVFLSFAT